MQKYQRLAMCENNNNNNKNKRIPVLQSGQRKNQNDYALSKQVDTKSEFGWISSDKVSRVRVRETRQKPWQAFGL